MKNHWLEKECVKRYAAMTSGELRNALRTIISLQSYGLAKHLHYKIRYIERELERRGESIAKAC